MSKTTKKWIITAAFFILTGALLFGGIMTVYKWDFTKLSTEKFQTKNHEINQVFKNISIDSDIADIKLVSSENSTCSVECYEYTNMSFSVEVEDETLVIKMTDTRKWYEYISISFKTPKVTIYLPQNEYGNAFIKGSTGDIHLPKGMIFENINISLSTGDVLCQSSAQNKIKISTTTGDIQAEGADANTMELSVSTGDIIASSVVCKDTINVKVSTGDAKLRNIECGSVISNGSTGDITLENVIANKSVNITRSTGDVKFDRSDADEIYVKTSTGDVYGSLLSDKNFITSTSTGSVKVPQSSSESNCRITTTTGSISITIK